MSKTPIAGSKAAKKPTGPQKKKRSFIFRAFKWLVLTVLALVLLVVGLLVALTQTQPGRNIITAQVERILSDKVLVGDVSIDRIRGPLFGRLSIEGAVLTDENGEIVVAVDSLRARYSLRELIRGTIIVDEAVLDGVTVHIVQDDTGVNLARLVQPRDEPQPAREQPSLLPDLRGAVELRNAFVTFHDHRGEAPILLASLDDLSIVADVVMGPDHPIEATVATLRAALATDLIALPSSALEIDNAHAILDDPMMFDVGRIFVAEATLIDVLASLASDADGPFSQLDASIAGLDLPSQTPNSIIGQANLIATDLGFAIDVSGPPTALHADVTIDGPSVIEIDATVDITQPTLPYSLLVEAADLAPGQWVNVGLPTVQADLIIAIEGQGTTPETAQFHARIDASDGAFDGLALDLLSVDASFADELLTLTTLELHAFDTVISASGTATLDQTVDIDLAISASDLSRLQEMDLGLPELQGDLDLTMSIAGQIPTPEQGADPITLVQTFADALDVTVHATGNGLQFDGNEVEWLELDVVTRTENEYDMGVDVRVRNADFAGQSLERADVELQLTDTQASIRVDAVQDAGHTEVRLATLARTDGSDFIFDIDVIEGEYDDLPIRVLNRPRLTLQMGESGPTGIAINTARVRLADLAVTLSGNYALSGSLAANVHVDQFDLSELAEFVSLPEGVSGAVELDATVRGRLARPTADISVRMFDIVYGGLPAVSGTVRATHDRGWFTVDVDTEALGVPFVSVDASGQVSMDLLNGEVELSQDTQLSLAVEIPSFDLELLGDALGGPMESAVGTMALNIEASGTLTEPQASARIWLSDAEIDVPISEDELLSLRSVDFLFESEYRPTSTGDPGLDATISVDWFKEPLLTLSVDLDADVRDLTDPNVDTAAWARAVAGAIVLEIPGFEIDRIPRSLREQIGLDAGRANFRASWDGQLSDGTVQLTAGVQHLVYQGNEPIDAALTIRSQEDTTLRLDVQYGPEPRPIVVALSYDIGFRNILENNIPMDAEMVGEITVPEFQLSSFALALPSLATQPGVARMSASISGQPTNPTVDVIVRVREIPLLNGAMANTTVQLHMDQDDAFVILEAYEGPTQVLDGRVDVEIPNGLAGLASGDLTPPAEWPLDATINIMDANIAAVLPPWLLEGIVEQPSGTLNGSVVAGGLLGDPEIDGQISLVDGEMGIVPLARTMSEVSFNIDISNDELRLTGLELRDAVGSATGELTVQLVDFFPSVGHAEIVLNRFFIPIDSESGMFVGGTIGVDISTDDRFMNVDVGLANMVIDVPETPASATSPRRIGNHILFVPEDIPPDQIGQRNPRGYVVEGTTEIERAPFALRVNIDTENNGRFTHPMIDTEFSVDLFIEIEGEEIRSDGEVRLIDGLVFFGNHELEIRRADLRFSGTGPAAFDPYIDLEAVDVLSRSTVEAIESQLGLSPSADDATITIAVRSPLSEIVARGRDAIEFRSDPPMADEDIIFILLTDRPRSDQSEVSNQAMASITPLLAGMIADQFGGLPVEIRIEGGGEQWHGISRVEGVRRLTDTLSVVGSIITGTDADDESNRYEVALEWIIARWRRNTIQAEVRAGDRGEGAAELGYTITIP